MNKRQSIDTIETLFDQVEHFIEEHLHSEEDENISARSYFPKVKVTDKYIMIPIYSVRCFNRAHQSAFKKQFPGVKVPEKDEEGVYWVKLKRMSLLDDAGSTEAGSMKKRKKKKKE